MPEVPPILRRKIVKGVLLKQREQSQTCLALPSRAKSVKQRKTKKKACLFSCFSEPPPILFKDSES